MKVVVGFGLVGAEFINLPSGIVVPQNGRERVGVNVVNERSYYNTWIGLKPCVLLYNQSSQKFRKCGFC